VSSARFTSCSDIVVTESRCTDHVSPPIASTFVVYSGAELLHARNASVASAITV
jgi:hypothetical protein